MNYLIVKEGMFTYHCGNQNKFISPQQAKIGNWKCSIINRQLVCIREHICKEGIARLKFVIFNNGLSRLTLKLPHQTCKKIFKRWLGRPNNFKLNGILSLPEGDITNSFPSFLVK